MDLESISTLKATIGTTTLPLTSKFSEESNLDESVSTKGWYQEDDFVLAISEGRGVASEIGIAALHWGTTTCLLFQFVDSPTYIRTMQQIFTHSPSQILVPITYLKPSPSKLVLFLQENFPDKVVGVPRKYFNDSNGLYYLKRYAVKETMNEADFSNLGQKYYLLASLATIFKTLEEQDQISFPNYSINMKFTNIQDIMSIDICTAKNLELVANLKSAKNRGQTLFGILNKTKTAMGSRLLRINVLQPLNDQNTIESRLDCIDKILKNEDHYLKLLECLKKDFIDIDKLISKIIRIPKIQSMKHFEGNLNNVLQLKKLIKQIDRVHEACEPFEHEIFTAIRKAFEHKNLTEILHKIDEIILEDANFEVDSLSARNQRCFAVKSGFNPFLDIARQAYQEGTNEAFEVLKNTEKEFNLPVKQFFHANTGFKMSTTIESLKGKALPSELIFISANKKTVQFTTLDLLKINERIKESMNEVYLMSETIVNDLLNFIRSRIGCLYGVSEAIALLDFLQGLATYASFNDSVRPEFTNTLAITNGRHPIEESFRNRIYVPNNIFCSEGLNFQVITGPNMSGKSSYMRMVALLSIMAQIGSFIPCKYASFRITDKILTRICNDDDLENNTSTFMMEMKEVSNIIHNVTDKSLVLIDELGRGTSVEDGIGIAMAVAETLVESKIAKALSFHHHVLNLHLTVDTVKSDISIPSFKFHYRIEKGITDEENYGISLANHAGFPQQVLDDALAISRNLCEQKLEIIHRQQLQMAKMKRLCFIHSLKWKVDQAIKYGSWQSQQQLLDFIDEAKQLLVSHINKNSNGNGNESADQSVSNEQTNNGE